MAQPPRPNDALFEFLDKAGNLILANLLFVLLSIPIITLPLTTAGLFAVMSLWARGKPFEVFRDFFEATRLHWRKASLLVLLDVLLGGLVAFNFTIFPLMNISQPITLLSQSVTVFVGLTLAMVNSYLWPLLVTFEDMTLRMLLDRSVRLTFIHLGRSLLTISTVAGVLVLSLIFLPAAALVLATFSGIALIVSQSSWRVIRRYLPADELAALEGGH